MGTDGRILLVSGQKSRATKLGYWVDGVVLGASKRSWLAWFAGHNPVEEGSGLFHFCLSVRCAASTKREHLAIVHVARFRAQSTGQAKTLAYGREGLVAYKAALNGEEVTAETEDDADGAPTPRGDTDEEAEAAAEALGERDRVVTPKAGAAGGPRALGKAQSVPQGGIDPALARALSAADAQVTRDAGAGGKAGTLALPAFNSVPPRIPFGGGAGIPDAGPPSGAGSAAEPAKAASAADAGTPASGKGGAPGSRGGIHAALLSQAERYATQKRVAPVAATSEAKRRRVLSSFVNLLTGGTADGGADDFLEVED